MKKGKRKKGSKLKRDYEGIMPLAITMLAIILVLFLFIKGYHSVNHAIENRDVEIVVRRPAVAGMFYPADKKALSEMIDNLMGMSNESKGVEGHIRGVIMPHAGYIYSGIVAAEVAELLKNGDYRTVIIMGPSHHKYFKGVSIVNVTHYETPLGMVKLSDKVRDMRKESIVTYERDAHTKEHSVEVEIPFLQKAISNFEIIPMVFGDVDPEKVAEMLLKYIDDDTLIVASSDLSHYYPYNVAIGLDKNCIDAVNNMSIELMRDRCEACGKLPILTLMYIARAKGWKAKVVDYKNSGDTAGNKQRVVGYMGAVFYENNDRPSKEDKIFLLKLARETLEKYLKGGKRPVVDESKLSKYLKSVKGCFVTLNKNHMLRGCIGHILPQEELYKCVMDNAINAALRDIRFYPVSYDELKDIDIEISILTVPEPLKYDSWQELLDKLVPLRDGVVLKQGFAQATYLPQVWEQLSDKELFLSHLCRKAGLKEDCWKDRATQISIYHAIVFDESEFSDELNIHH